MKLSDLKNYTVVSSTPEQTQQTEKPKSFGQKVLDVGTAVSNFVGGKGIADTFGAELAKIGKSEQEKQFISQNQPSTKEAIGSGIQVGSILIPGAASGAGLLTKAAIGAGTGYAMDVGSKLQDKNKSIPEALVPGAGTAVGAALPVAGAGIGYASRVVGRLFKGIGSAVSGVPTKTIDEIINNPKVAQKASDILTKKGNDFVLEENAKQIVNGVSKIRQEARNAYGQAVQSLKETDINPTTFRTAVSQSLDKIGSVIKKGERKLSTAEFDNPSMVKRANTLINKLSTTNLDGYSLNKLQNQIDSSAFKTTGNDAQRLAFNAFIHDLSNSVKTAINQSTDKLGEINKKFSTDMQLAEATQKIFGKVNFKNLPEVATAAKKLEGLFNQKGLDPRTVDDFLNRIGVSAKDFKTTEAIRQISGKEPMAANAPGFNVGEIMRTATGSIITPETVKNIMIKTGMAKEKLTPFLNGLKTLSPALQKTLIQALLQIQRQEE